jgi:hypothetical protein
MGLYSDINYVYAQVKSRYDAAPPEQRRWMAKPMRPAALETSEATEVEEENVVAEAERAGGARKRTSKRTTRKLMRTEKAPGEKVLSTRPQVPLAGWEVDSDGSSEQLENAEVEDAVSNVVLP